MKVPDFVTNLKSWELLKLKFFCEFSRKKKEFRIFSESSENFENWKIKFIFSKMCLQKKFLKIVFYFFFEKIEF